MNPLLNRKFIFVAGKGGVGRTTITLCIGKWAARRGKKVLICLAHSGSRYRHVIDDSKKSVIQVIEPNLSLLNLDPVVAREEYALKIIRNQLLHRLVFSNRYVNNFLDAIPGLSEWAMLGKATWHVLPDAPVNERYDMVVFDSPPTGHGLDILRLPSAIAGSVQGGLMHRDAASRVSLLSDATRTGIVGVSLAEELPVNETIELSEELLQNGLPLSAIAVNKLLDVLPDGAEAFCDSDCPQNQKQRGQPWARPAMLKREQRKEQLIHMQRLTKRISVPLLQLPRLDDANLNRESLNALTDHLADEFRRHSL
jgi:anion-transporting  ArsA/GET3 family ATPase